MVNQNFRVGRPSSKLRPNPPWISHIETQNLRLVLFGRGLLGSLLGLGSLSGRLALASLVLHVLIINVQGLVDLGAQGLLILKPRLINISNLLRSIRDSRFNVALTS